jgi:hypothetical protein
MSSWIFEVLYYQAKCLKFSSVAALTINKFKKSNNSSMRSFVCFALVIITLVPSTISKIPEVPKIAEVSESLLDKSISAGWFSGKLTESDFTNSVNILLDKVFSENQVGSLVMIADF